MKMLYLLRHGKSDWSIGASSDFDRPLNERGDKETLQMGTYMLDKRYIPDCIISSPAKRTTETLENIVTKLSYTGEVDFRENLYLASSEKIQKEIDLKDCDSLLVIGHNPGIETLLNKIVGGYHTMKTSHLAVIDFEKKELIDFIRPKEF